MRSARIAGLVVALSLAVTGIGLSQTADSPTRLVIDVSGATYSSAKSRWTSGVDPVKEVRGSQWRKGIARIVVEMTRNDVGYRIDETPVGLVIMVETKPETAKL